MDLYINISIFLMSIKFKVKFIIKKILFDCILVDYVLI